MPIQSLPKANPRSNLLSILFGVLSLMCFAGAALTLLLVVTSAQDRLLTTLVFIVLAGLAMVFRGLRSRLD